MPKPSTFDWNHAHDLFNQGLKIPRIAEIIGAKPNTVATRARRGNWAENRTRAVQAVSKVVQNMIQSRPKTVQERAEKWLEREMCAVEDITVKLDAVEIPSELPKLKEHIEVRAMNGKYGRSTFGLDNQATNVQINIGMSGQLSAIEPVPIDIEPVPPTSD